MHTPETVKRILRERFIARELPGTFIIDVRSVQSAGPGLQTFDVILDGGSGTTPWWRESISFDPNASEDKIARVLDTELDRHPLKG
jgi:hypothetical protein